MNGKSSISALQELMASRNLPYPTYTEEHFGTGFKCTVTAAGITASGVGSTKKSAKHESAKNALDKLNPSLHTQICVFVNTPPIQQKPLNNYVGELNEFSLKKGVRQPEYESVTMTSGGQFLHKCSFVGQETIGTGLNKKDAKQDAARRMLDLIRNMDPAMILTERYVTKPKTEFLVTDRDIILRKYKMLSLNQPDSPNNNPTIFEKTEIKIEPGDDVKTLTAKLQSYGINYTLQELQHSPYAMCVKINGTDLTFIAVDENREEAIRKVLLDVVECSKTGVPLNTNDLIKFD